MYSSRLSPVCSETHLPLLCRARKRLICVTVIRPFNRIANCYSNTVEASVASCIRNGRVEHEESAVI
jgi:hypothetical protein